MIKMFLKSALVASFALASGVSVDGFNSPESILVKGDYVFVANVGIEPKPTDKDGDGYISLLDKNAKILDKNFLSNLNAPKGMALSKNTLFVVDVDEVKGFDIVTKKQIFSLVIEGTKFLNDIAIKDKSTLVVSTTDSGKIYEVNVKKKTYTPIIDVAFANGVLIENNKLFFVTSGSKKESNPDGKGRIYEYDFNTKKQEIISEVIGQLDGIQKVADMIYCSDWVNGGVHSYNIKTKAQAVLELDKVSGPADFWIDKKSKKLWLPKMVENKILVTDIK